jgi:hypothetical protein
VGLGSWWGSDEELLINRWVKHPAGSSVTKSQIDEVRNAVEKVREKDMLAFRNNLRRQDMPDGKIDEECERFGKRFPRNKIVVLDVDKEKHVSVNVFPALDILGARILSDGKTCVTLTGEGMIVIWNIEDQRVISRNWTGGATLLAADRSGTVVATGDNKSISLIDLKGSKCLAKFALPEKGFEPPYVYVPPGSDVPWNSPFKKENAHEIEFFALNTLTKRLAVLYVDGLIEVWNYPDKWTGKTVTRSLRPRITRKKKEATEKN